MNEQQLDLLPSLKGNRDGETFSELRDCDRLNRQCQDVFDVVKNGLWITLADLAEATGHPDASVSARLRDLRKSRFGGFEIEREYVCRGQWRYRMVLRNAKERF